MNERKIQELSTNGAQDKQTKGKENINSVDWKIVTLKEIAQINPSKKEISKIPDETYVSFVPMAFVDENKGVISKMEIRKLGEVRKNYKYFRDGDVIFAKITPCMENGKCAVAFNLKNHIGLGSTEFHVIRPNNSVLAKWIWYYLRQQKIRQKATRYFTGSVGQQRVPAEFLENLLIPLPPLEEQKLIVAKLDSIFSKIDEIEKRRKEAIEEAEKIMEAALNKVFAKAEEKRWEKVKLGDKTIIASGGTPKRSVKEYWNGDIPFVKITDINDDHPIIIETEETITVEGLQNSSAKIFPKGTILFSIFATIGKLGVLGITAATNQAIVGIQIKNKNELNKDYLFYILKFYGYKLNYLSRGAAQNNINQRILKKLEFPLPSLTEQRKIVNYLVAISKKQFALIETQKEMLNSIQKLRDSISDTFFKFHIE